MAWTRNPKNILDEEDLIAARDLSWRYDHTMIWALWAILEVSGNGQRTGRRPAIDQCRT